MASKVQTYEAAGRQDKRAIRQAETGRVPAQRSLIGDSKTASNDFHRSD